MPCLVLAVRLLTLSITVFKALTLLIEAFVFHVGLAAVLPLFKREEDEDLYDELDDEPDQDLDDDLEPEENHLPPPLPPLPPLPQVKHIVQSNTRRRYLESAEII